MLAVGQALARGWLAREELRQAVVARPHRVAQLVEAALAEAGAARMGA